MPPRGQVPGERGQGGALVAQVVQAVAGPQQVGRGVQVDQGGGQVAGDGGEAVGVAEPGGALAGPFQQGRGAVDGHDTGRGEALGEQARDHARPAAGVDDHAGVARLLGQPGRHLPVQGREQLGLGLQQRGHDGPVDVRVTVVSVTAVAVAGGGGVVVVVRARVVALVLLRHGDQPLLSVRPGCDDAPRRGQFRCRDGKKTRADFLFPGRPRGACTGR
ncbi:hypothetical protein GCM10010524_60860 [Streptomyces mexicanus]